MVIQKINNNNGSSDLLSNKWIYRVRVEAFGSTNYRKVLNSAPLWGNDRSELYLFSLVRKSNSRNHSLGYYNIFQRRKGTKDAKHNLETKKGSNVFICLPVLSKYCTSTDSRFLECLDKYKLSWGPTQR